MLYREIIGGFLNIHAKHKGLNAVLGHFRRVRKNWEKQLLYSSSLPVCPQGTNRFPLDVFSRNFAFEDF